MTCVFGSWFGSVSRVCGNNALLLRSCWLTSKNNENNILAQAVRSQLVDRRQRHLSFTNTIAISLAVGSATVCPGVQSTVMKVHIRASSTSRRTDAPRLRWAWQRNRDRDEAPQSLGGATAACWCLGAVQTRYKRLTRSLCGNWCGNSISITADCNCWVRFDCTSGAQAESVSVQGASKKKCNVTNENM